MMAAAISVLTPMVEVAKRPKNTPTIAGVSKEE